MLFYYYKRKILFILIKYRIKVNYIKWDMKYGFYNFFLYVEIEKVYYIESIIEIIRGLKEWGRRDGRKFFSGYWVVVGSRKGIGV